ncbi:glycerophosphodiester phosphodiesterase family protein [Aquimarina longa]|uniref:glycerophosphodiester phosphodiesterase family protein n=1 Tax=Aquimarina longa TaxID=1080221 RepID=UPI0009ECC1B3|nr:glycerophosphodiester phosphodiesterase family protein [Aquimarina longa]
MKKNIFKAIIVILISACSTNTSNTPDKNAPVSAENLVKISSIEEKIANLKDSKNKEIIVVAHRGDWRNAPENSLKAIANCIKMGVDMVEIDIRETKDGHLVVMHDETIDRTTTGKGFVKDWTLDSLKTLQLIDGLRIPTAHKIPTLEEALLVAKDKILINLDKSYSIFDKCYEVIKKTGTLNQVVIKGVKKREEVEGEFGEYLDKVFFMPIIPLPNPQSQEIVDDYLKHHVPVAFEFVVPQDTLKIITYFDDIRAKGSSVWVNSLWSHHNGGHDDEKAVEDIDTYKWYVDHNVDIIQTDRPALLLEYLRSVGLHK